MVEIGDGREDESELIEGVGDKGRGRGEVKLGVLRSGSLAIMRG